MVAATLAAGIAGAATIGPDHTTSAHTNASATTTSTSVATPPATTVPGGPGPSSAVLAAGMLAPVDLGGFYRVNDPYASGVLSTAPCLAGVGPSQAQSGRAFVGLVVPGGHPAITEVAVSYPGSAAEQVYQSVNQTLAACAAFSVNLEGSGATVQMTRQNLPPVGDASSAFGGTFTVSGRSETLQVEVVLDGKIVLVVVYVDTVPASNAIYGDMPSTVGAAIGKLA